MATGPWGGSRDNQGTEDFWSSTTIFNDTMLMEYTPLIICQSAKVLLVCGLSEAITGSCQLFSEEPLFAESNG